MWVNDLAASPSDLLSVSVDVSALVLRDDLANLTRRAVSVRVTPISITRLQTKFGMNSLHQVTVIFVLVDSVKTYYTPYSELFFFRFFNKTLITQKHLTIHKM